MIQKLERCHSCLFNVFNGSRFAKKIIAISSPTYPGQNLVSKIEQVLLQRTWYLQLNNMLFSIRLPIIEAHFRCTNKLFWIFLRFSIQLQNNLTKNTHFLKPDISEIVIHGESICKEQILLLCIYHLRPMP